MEAEEIRIEVTMVEKFGDHCNQLKQFAVDMSAFERERGLRSIEKYT